MKNTSRSTPVSVSEHILGLALRDAQHDVLRRPVQEPVAHPPDAASERGRMPSPHGAVSTLDRPRGRMPHATTGGMRPARQRQSRGADDGELGEHGVGGLGIHRRAKRRVLRRRGRDEDLVDVLRPSPCVPDRRRPPARALGEHGLVVDLGIRGPGQELRARAPHRIGEPVAGEEAHAMTRALRSARRRRASGRRGRPRRSQRGGRRAIGCSLHAPGWTSGE